MDESKDLKLLFAQRAKYFRYLQLYLAHCHLIMDLGKFCCDFPPSESDFKEYVRLFYETEDYESVLDVKLDSAWSPEGIEYVNKWLSYLENKRPS